MSQLALATGLRVGDCLDGLRSLPAGRANLCVTSPPYWMQRSYGIARWEGGDRACPHMPGGASRVGASSLQGGKGSSGHQQEGYGATCRKCGAVRLNDGEHGSEFSLAEYIEQQVAVFREVRRVLRDDGVLFLNLGDKAVGSGGAGGDYNDGGLKAGQPKFVRANGEDLKPKNIYGLPWRIAFALQADGWMLRRDIIWVKSLSFAPVVGSCMPESAGDRPTSAHEYIFMFTKKPRYWYDGEAEREAASPFTNARGNGSRNKRVGFGEGVRANDDFGSATVDRVPTRNLRDVWYIQPEPMSWMICTACMEVYDGRQYGRLALNEQCRVCKCGRSDSWTSHFAAFPSKLVRVCVNLACPERVCAACGEPWRRRVEKSRTFEGGSGRSGRDAVGKHGADLQGGGETGDIRRGPVVHTTDLGFFPACECGGPEDLRPGELEVIASPTGSRVAEDDCLVSGRRGYNRVRSPQDGTRDITRYEQRKYAEQLRESPYRREMEAEAGTAFAHYVRTDCSGARPVPEGWLEIWISRGWLARVTPPSLDGVETRPGLVLDPYLGSGTTALVAEKMGRQWAGFELSPIYASLIEERLRRQREQRRLEL